MAGTNYCSCKTKPLQQLDINLKDLYNSPPLLTYENQDTSTIIEQKAEIQTVVQYESILEQYDFKNDESNQVSILEIDDKNETLDDKIEI